MVNKGTGAVNRQAEMVTRRYVQNEHLGMGTFAHTQTLDVPIS